MSKLEVLSNNDLTIKKHKPKCGIWRFCFGINFIFYDASRKILF